MRKSCRSFGTNLRALKASMPMASSLSPSSLLTATTMCSLNRDFCSRAAPPDGSRHCHGLAAAAAENAVASKWPDDPVSERRFYDLFLRLLYNLEVGKILMGNASH